jgi:uncharacterized protein HemX
MLNSIRTKILLAILAALAVIASAAVYQRHQAEAQRKRDELFRQQVESLKKKHNAAAGNEGDTWRNYIP